MKDSLNNKNLMETGLINSETVSLNKSTKYQLIRYKKFYIANFLKMMKFKVLPKIKALEEFGVKLFKKKLKN